MKPHKHAEVIKAWADGAQIQYKTHHDEVFKDWIGTPSWSDNVEYRIKPAEPEREYPKTLLSGDEVDKIYMAAPGGKSGNDDLLEVANAALRHACDYGQIVTRAEFDRAVGDRKRRDSAIARNIYSAMEQSVGAGIIPLELLEIDDIVMNTK